MRRSLSWGAWLIQEMVRPFRYRPAMLTLTYRDVDGFVPRHISELLNHIRNWLARRGQKLLYVWVAELQKRGALHYHIVVWLPRGLTLPKPDKQDWWPHGSTRIEWARNPIGYLIKYSSKFDSKYGLPKGAPPSRLRPFRSVRKADSTLAQPALMAQTSCRDRQLICAS